MFAWARVRYARERGSHGRWSGRSPRPVRAESTPVEVYTAIKMLRTLGLAGCLFGPWLLAANAQYDVLTFHGDRQRTGWISIEKILTPRNVAGGEFGPVWDSPQFDSVTISGNTYLPHVYASPLYVDRVTMTADAYAGRTFHVVYAASSNGFVYAVNASRAAVPRTGGRRGPDPAGAGTILWPRQRNLWVTDTVEWRREGRLA